MTDRQRPARTRRVDLFVAPVSASAPVVNPVEFDETFTIPANTGLCAFDVEITAEVGLAGDLDGFCAALAD